MLNKNLDPGISKRTRNSSVTMVNLKSFPDGKSALLTGHTGMTEGANAGNAGEKEQLPYRL